MKINRYKSGSDLNPKDVKEMILIASHYFPKCANIAEVLKRHLDEGSSVITARLTERIIGFSVSSLCKLATPFYKNPIPVIYQRELYVDPDFHGKYIGIALQIATIQNALGFFWFANRFALFCTTQNPIIARNFSFFSTCYPNIQHSSLIDKLDFINKLLPFIHGREIDKDMCISGTFKAKIKDVDYSYWWNKYYKSRYEEHNQLIFEKLFYTKDGKIYHRGLNLLLIGYAQPYAFLKRLIEIQFKIFYNKFIH